MSNVESAYEYFLGHGFTPAQSSGIVGNLIQESGVNPESVQSGGPGRGIAQWSLGGRWMPSLATGNQAVDLNNQEQYILDELQQNPSYGLAALQQASTPTQAAQIFGTQYERYGVEGGRVADAQQVFNEAQSGNWPSVTTGSTTATGGSGTATLDSSSGDWWTAIKNSLVPGSGGTGGFNPLSDVGKIADEAATAMGFAAQKSPQQLQGSGFLGSLDELLNPSISLLNPWGAITMAMARGGLALFGLAMIVAGVAIITFGTETGRTVIGDTAKAAVVA